MIERTWKLSHRWVTSTSFDPQHPYDWWGLRRASQPVWMVFHARHLHLSKALYILLLCGGDHMLIAGLTCKYNHLHFPMHQKGSRAASPFIQIFHPIFVPARSCYTLTQFSKLGNVRQEALPWDRSSFRESNDRERKCYVCSIPCTHDLHVRMGPSTVGCLISCDLLLCKDPFKRLSYFDGDFFLIVSNGDIS